MRKEMNDIVLVDDNPAILYGLSEIFKRRGYTVRTASDGFSTLALLRDRIPGILLSDLNMPGMSGFELLSVVRRRFPVIAVIAMSGAHSGVFVLRGLRQMRFMLKVQTAQLDYLRSYGRSRIETHVNRCEPRYRFGYRTCRLTNVAGQP